MDVEAVLFDLDGTLLDRRGSFERFVRDQWSRFRGALRGVHADQYAQTLIQLDGDGYAPRKELFTTMTSKFQLPAALAEDLLSDYRAGFPGCCSLFPDAADTLATVRASGLKLGLITNGSASMQSRKVECLGLSSAFDTILISAAEGVSKPDIEIFQRAAERLLVDPGHAVFVGDHPEVDVAGARAAGMFAIWRRDAAVSRVVEADAIIDRMSELPAVLGLESRQQ